MDIKRKINRINRDCPRKGTIPIYLLLLSLSLCIFLITLIPNNTAYSLPNIDEIQKGSIEITYPSEHSMHINAKDTDTIINYTSFNIDTKESLILNLPSNESQILNRVIGIESSSILGNLECNNGTFMLINTHGIYVGEQATINTHNLILSTRDIDNTDFLNKDYLFKNLSKDQLDTLLINKGTINIQDAGFGILIAGAIENRGKIIAKLGTIALLAGDYVRLTLSDDSLISVAIEKPQASKILDSEGNPIINQIHNKGTLSAEGGTIILKAESIEDIFRNAINLEGIVEAKSIEQSEGVIRIVADTDVSIKVDKLEATKIEIGQLNNLLQQEEQGQDYIKDALIPKNVTIEEESSIIRAEHLISIKAIDTIRISSIIEAPNVTLESGNTIDTTNQAIIQATNLNLLSNKFGTYTTPLNINADNIQIEKLSNTLSIIESIGIGESILTRGPPDTWGAILSNQYDSLTIKADRISIEGDNPLYLYGNITFHNLECIVPNKYIYFQEGKTYTFKDSLDLGPHTKNPPLYLYSSHEGYPWFIDIDTLDNNYSIQRVAVRDSFNINTDSPISTYRSINKGNNSFWLTNTHTWVGDTSNLWDVDTNWDPETSPSGDAVAFTSGSAASLINANISITSLTINGYTGTLTLDTGITLTITGAYSQSGGTFACNNGTISLGTDFTKTGGTFNEGTGTVKFTGNYNASLDISTTETFYNVIINKTDVSAFKRYNLNIASGDTMVVDGTLTLTDGAVNTGTVDAKGDISQASTFLGGTARLNFANDSVAQTYTLNGGTGPHLYYDSAADDDDEMTFTEDSSLYGLYITSGFSGTISPTYGVYNLTIKQGDYIQEAGTFDAPGGTLYIGLNSSSDADFTKTGGTFNEGTGTVEFTGNYNASLDISTTETFYNVIINKTDVSGFGRYNLNIASGDTMVVDGTLTLTDGAVNTGTVDAKGDISQASTFLGGTARLNFANDSVAQTYTLNGGTGPHLYYDSAADANDTVVFTANGGLYGLTLTSGFDGTTNFTYNGYAMTIGNGDFTQAGGTFTAPGTLYIGDAFTKTGGTFDEGTGTVEFTGNYNASLDISTTETFYNVIINKTDVSAFERYNLNIASGDTMVVDGTLTLTDGAVNTGTVDAKGNVTVQSAFSGGSALLTFTGTSASGLATQTFDLTGATGNFNADITVNKTEGQVNLASALVMDASNQDLTIQEGTFDLNGYNLTVNGTSGKLTVESGGNLRLKGSETITANATYPDCQATSTVTYYGTGTYSSLAAGDTYSNLTFTDTGTWTTDAALTVNNNLSLTNATLDIADNDLTVTGTFTNNSILKLIGAAAQTITYTNDTDSGTIEYNGTGSYTGLKGGSDYYNLTFSGTGGYTLTGDIDVNNNFTQSAGTVTSTSGNLNVGSNFNHSAGTFTHNSGTVIFDSTSNATISGDTTFNDLTCITEGKTLTFEENKTQTIVGTLTLTGQSGDLITLVSQTEGQQWSIDPQGTRDVSYVDVQDSNNINTTAINPTNSTDSGNNINWFVEETTTGTSTPPNPPEPPTPPELPPSPSTPEVDEEDNIIMPDEPVIEEPDEEAPQEEPVLGPPLEEPEEGGESPEGEPEEPSEEVTEGEEVAEEEVTEEEEVSEEEAEAGEEEAEGEDPFGPQDKQKKYEKKYIKGKYKTVVIVFEGKVVACPYDEEGPEFEKGTTLTEGQRTTQEGEVK